MADRDTGWFRGQGGVIWPIDLPLPADMQEQLVKGYLMRVNEDGTPYAEPGLTGDTPADPEPEQPPASNANKATWVGYAHRVHGVSIDDAEAMTKTDLIELYGPTA